LPHSAFSYRRPTVLLLLLILPFLAAAQLGNEWIDYTRQHWQLDVVNDGLYRLSYNELVSAGVPVSTIAADELKIFGRGEEQYLSVQDGGDGTLDPGDFIELYARGNDGWLDREVYDSPEHQTNPEYSLFNDTASYFLTWSPAPSQRTEVYTSTTDPATLTPAPYVNYRSRLNFTSTYLLGKQDVNGIALPYYEEAEGWFDSRFAMGQSRTHQVPHPFPFLGAEAPDATVRAVSASASLAPGIVNHHLQVGYGEPFNLVVDSIYYGYQLNVIDFSIAPDAFSGTSLPVTHRSVDDLGVASDWHAVSWLQLDYARLPEFPEGGEQRFRLKNFDVSTEGRLDILNYPGEEPRLYVIAANGLRRQVPLTQSGSTLTAIVPFIDNPGAVELLLLEATAAQEVTDLRPVTQSGFFTDYTAVQQDSAFVIVSHRSLWPAATNYAFYRESQGMDVVLADVDELYMQYAAGIRKHPLAIRRFCADLIESWSSDPSHLFLIGKSIFEMKISATEGARDNESHYARNLVPSWGYPTSDLTFTSGLGGTLVEPAIPTGRLSAESIEQVLDYLNKVIEFESQEPAPWMKRVLHFGGGGNAFEQGLFKTYLNQYKTIVQDTCFGGDVFSFFKTNTDPIQLNVSDSIQLLINEGVSMMTFFGHASSTGFDVNIDSPANYNNQGRYPLLVGNSCYTGNIHLPTTTSTSENFVLVPNAGVIGFIAKGDLGAPSYLNVWTENFYRQNFQQNYGASIGQNMKRAVQSFQSPAMNLLTHNTALTFALHGDPAIVLNAWEAPDLAVNIDGIVFEPTEVSTEIETFQVKVAINNIGKATNQPFGVELIRHLPSGQDTSLVLEMPPVYARDTAVFTLPVDLLNGVGLNSFDVLVDFPADAVEELEELTNNTVTGKELFITSGNLVPVYPFDFTIEPGAPARLKASTGDPFAPVRTYRFQIDTTDGFDSPLLTQTTLTQSGGVVEWELPLTLQNNRVYYWRTAAEPNPGEDYNWRMHSFELRYGDRGWGQSHFEQFRDNRFNKIVFDETERDFDFTIGDAELKCTVYGDPGSVFEISATRYQIDLDVQDYGGCGNAAALHVAVIDPNTLAPWESNYNDLYPQNDFGNLMSCANGRERPEKYFIFRQNNAAEMAGLSDMLANAVPEGHYVLIYTWKYVNYDGWDAHAPELYDLMSDLGAQAIGNTADSIPFIFFAQKGDLASAQEVVGATSDALIELETTLTGSFGDGRITSPLFGPVSAWESLFWEIDSEPADSSRVKVFGSNVGQPDVEIADWAEAQDGWPELGDEVNAWQYPTLRLENTLFDATEQTPAQLKAWRLIGEHVPECALNPNAGFYFPKDTVQQGEPLVIAVAIENIGAYDMDSLLVRYTLRGNGQSAQLVPYDRQDSLRVGEVMIDTLEIATGGLQGDMTLRIEANPRNVGGLFDQPEQYHFNNLAELRFHVAEDRINPILDVTFDGRHILDGDIVSAEPEVRISLDDENEFLLLDEPSDTASFKVFLTWPDGQQDPVYFENPAVLSFFPATDAANKAYLEYRPLLEQDGTYELLVQASDKSGNASGLVDYRITFDVQSKPTITDVLNYPNPFSTRTQFVFTLTGTEPPDEVLIRIMTISGRVVREIRSDELGPLQIGRNRTAFWWYGTDEFGDPLANGIYLYTVRARLRGEDLDLSETGASPFFQNGIGKMYLLR
jgi:hypothetical protein